MSREKMIRLQDAIQERIEKVEPEDLGKPAVVEYAKNLAKLHCALEQMGGDGYSQRSAYREGQEWGAYRRGRDSMGRYTSYDAGYDAGYAEAKGMGSKETIRKILRDPDLSWDAKEALKKAMEQMR